MKEMLHKCLKHTANAIALAVVFWPWMVYRLETLLVVAGKAFPGWSQAFSLLPGLPGVYFRRAFYRLVLSHCSDDAYISFGTVFSHPTARVGRNVYVGLFCVIGDVTLEDDVIVASHVSIANGPAQHGIERLDIPIREQPGDWPRITIGQDAWIGERAVVLADVGKHCVIGAGAVVTKSVPDYAIAVGVPARVVSSRLPAGLAEAVQSLEPAPPFSETKV
jgi:virginiamycin A acetyltransferase